MLHITFLMFWLYDPALCCVFYLIVSSIKPLSNNKTSQTSLTEKVQRREPFAFMWLLFIGTLQIQK